MAKTIGNDDIDLIDVCRVIYKNWKQIIFVVVLSAGVTGLLNMQQKTMYSATASFFPVTMRRGSENINVFKSRSSLLTLEYLVLSLLRSRSMGEKVVKDLTFQNKIQPDDLEAERIDLQSRVKIENVGGIINLTVRHEDPRLAADIANSFVDNLEYFNRKMELGVHRSLVNVIDRAVVPKHRLSRRTAAKMLIAVLISSVVVFFIVFFREYIKKNDFINKIKN